jgi:hypothetical protein
VTAVFEALVDLPRSPGEFGADPAAVALDMLAWTRVEVVAGRPLVDGLGEVAAVRTVRSAVSGEGGGQFAESFDGDGSAAGPAPPRRQGVDSPFKDADVVGTSDLVGAVVA